MPPATLRAVDTAPPPDDGRQQLRQAIGRVQAAHDSVARAEQARDTIHDRVLAAFRARDDAVSRLRVAEADNQRDRIAVLMGEVAEGPSLSQLREAADTAENLLTAARQDEQLLDEEIRRRRASLSFAEEARTQAIAAVLQPHVESLLAARCRHLAQAATIDAAIQALPVAARPDNFDARRDYPDALTLAAQWRDAALALEIDPSADIPKEIP